MKKIKFYTYLFLVISLTFVQSKKVNCEEVYCPYPIIFVHGFNSDGSTAFIEAKRYFSQYFRDTVGYYKYPYNWDYWSKYFPGSDLFLYRYFPYCNYGKEKYGPISRNGSAPTIATEVFKKLIDNALKEPYYPADYPENEKKVIIVVHSMGGLVTRSLLKQFPEYQNLIDKVIF